MVSIAVIYKFLYNDGVEFARLLTLAGDEPLFETGLLLAGEDDANYLRRQLSQWTQTGRLIQFRRGLYTLAPPYQKTNPHPFVVANRLVAGAYVSTHAALGYYSLIPEHVAAITSVTTGRPAAWNTALGRFTFQHIKPSLFFGYERLRVDRNQYAYVATPEKALLDLVYLQPDGDNPAYLESLRLQNLDRLDVDRLLDYAKQAEKPKLVRAAGAVVELAEEEAATYETL